MLEELDFLYKRAQFRLNKNYNNTLGKINVFREYEETLECTPVEIPQIEEFEKRFKKRDLLWRSKEDFKNKKEIWYFKEFL